MSREIQIIEPVNRSKYLPGGTVSNSYQKRVAKRHTPFGRQRRRDKRDDIGAYKKNADTAF